jgi:hypothetical protein
MSLMYVESRQGQACVSGGGNTVDFGRFKSRVRNRDAAWDCTVFRSPASNLRDVVFGPVTFAFDDAGVGMMA